MKTTLIIGLEKGIKSESPAVHMDIVGFPEHILPGEHFRLKELPQEAGSIKIRSRIWNEGLGLGIFCEVSEELLGYLIKRSRPGSDMPGGPTTSYAHPVYVWSWA